MNRRVVNILGVGFNMEDLEYGPINQAFDQFYRTYLSSRQMDFSVFNNVADDFFDFVEAKNIPFNADPSQDCKAAYHDGFFNNFTIAWKTEIDNGNFRNAIDVWHKSIEFARHWESNNGGHIHKGTPLSFEALSKIENEELDLGFVLMHEAYLEDLEKNQGDDNFTSPGKAFIEFNEQSSSYFQPKLDEVKQFFETEFLTNANLSFDDFKRSFTDNTSIPILIKYQFLFNVFRIWKSHKHLGNFDATNTMLGLWYMEAIFSLCRLIEPIYKVTKNSNPQSNKAIYQALCGTTPNIFDVIRVRQNFDNSIFTQELANILANQSINLSGTAHNLSSQEKDTLLAYGFRNLSAHELYEDNTINQNIKDILQSVFNTLFEAFR